MLSLSRKGKNCLPLESKRPHLNLTFVAFLIEIIVVGRDDVIGKKAKPPYSKLPFNDNGWIRFIQEAERLASCLENSVPQPLYVGAPGGIWRSASGRQVGRSEEEGTLLLSLLYCFRLFNSPLCSRAGRVSVRRSSSTYQQPGATELLKRRRQNAFLSHPFGLHRFPLQRQLLFQK